MRNFAVITLHQPWASLIAFGHKTVEVRSHRQFAGLVGRRIAIHAGRKIIGLGWEYYRRCDGRALRPVRDFLDAPGALPSGAVVCTAYVQAFAPLGAGWNAQALCDVWPGDYGLLLRDVRPVDPPIPARGRQGVWYGEFEGEA